MFKKRKFNRWVGFSTRTEDWTGTERNSLIPPIIGAPFPADYPFKIYKISDDSSLVVNNNSFFAPRNTTITLKLAIQKGNVYDLSKFNSFRDSPLLVSKRDNGNYHFVSANSTQEFTEEEMEEFSVPVFINGHKMEKIDFSKPATVEQATVEVRVKFDSSGSSSLVSSPFDSSQILMVFSVNDQGDNKFDAISKVEILTHDQIAARGAEDGLANSIFLKKKKIVNFFSASPISYYAIIDSVDASYTYKNNFEISTDTYSPLTKTLKRGEKFFTHSFVTRPDSFTPNGTETFYDHLLIRI